VESSGKRTRGPNKQTPWSRRSSDGLSVLRLALDTHDPAQRGSIEAMFSTAFSLRRAVQRDARSSCRAYWAATHERARDPAAVRARLGLSRKAFEHAAFAHLDAAPHLRRFTTKALAMHLADSVWTGTERNLFRDARGNRHGLGRIGRYYDFARLPGRARSHTTENKWETFRLHGTLDGHRAAYSNRDGDFVQPRHLRPVHSDAWWSYEGPLVMVFSGLPGGTLVLPVRLPTAPSNQPILDHHLADPCRWHKVDLVRRRDAHAAGGWRYEAHLIVLTTPYVSPAVATRRANTAIASMDRTAGVDVNVSNVTVASHDMGRAMRVTRVERDEAQRAKDHKRSRRTRRRQRELDRSRRAANRAQYQLSKRQEKRARRRAAAGLSPVKVLPMGPRNARTDGVPLQSYKRDQLSKAYQHMRAAEAADAAAATQARRDRARQIATDLVATHGYQLVAEDVRVSTWSRSWGRGVAAFSPGTLLAAIDREARAVAAHAGGDGGVIRAATHTTAMSQHCPCGARVDKRLADRIHRCDRCRLHGDRDAVSAVLASFVVLEKRGEPASARVDYQLAGAALGEIRRVLSPYSGWQDTLSESTDLSARDGSFVAGWTSTSVTALRSGRVARRNVGMASCPTLNETGFGWTTSDRTRVRTNMSSRYVLQWAYLRDTS
jgi:hypothetical protein